MGKRKLVSMVVTLLVVGVVCVVQATAEAVDEYNSKCAGCHGADGLGGAPIDGSICSLKTIDEIIECYSGISRHDGIEECDETCINETNTYIFDTLLLEIGKGQYEQMCASCHGDDGMAGKPIDGSHCVLDTLEDIVSCYPGINPHTNISGCDEACVWNVNRYIFVELLDNVDLEPADDAVDEYNLKCASCHGEDGLGSAPIDGSDCSLKTVDEIIECYSTISAHNAIDACDETCVEETNTYIFNTLLPEMLEIGKGQYKQMCASCHGNDGMEGTPLDGSVCALDTLENIVSCYPEITQHSGISSCDEACVWNVNRYVFLELLGNADLEPADDDDIDAGATSGAIAVNNDNWVSCFISSCQ